MNTKFNTLVRILDHLRNEAPETFRKLRPFETDSDYHEKLMQARSRAYIHLFLKVKFGLLDFEQRERFITEGTGDGGIDAYYIDSAARKVFLIQSKFRATGDNFTDVEIKLKELLNMEVKRVCLGETDSINGNPFNGSILRLQKRLAETEEIEKFEFVIVIMANVKPSHTPRLKTFFPTEMNIELFNYKRSFDELVLPVVSGTYFEEEEVKIELDLNKLRLEEARISYMVKTAGMECRIRVLFVPTIEIAKTLLKYRNSILRFNPRSYLELAHNYVNQAIENSIVKITTNEFALFNNGITVVSTGCDIAKYVGKKAAARLAIKKPQIINGGQTAYTLSRILERQLLGQVPKTVFDGKEVLVKVIELPEDELSPKDRAILIQEISRATNQQTDVNEADRRSNDEVQTRFQKVIFDDFGLFYERKRGEFSDGLRDGYIQKSDVINREIFIRICNACDMKPSEARKQGINTLFREMNFNRTLNDVSRCAEYVFAYQCYELLANTERSFAYTGDKSGFSKYGNGLRYGKYAIIAACNLLYQANAQKRDPQLTVNRALRNWKAFEKQIAKKSSNSDYGWWNSSSALPGAVSTFDFDNYYKGRTINRDLHDYFSGKWKIASSSKGI